MQPLRIGTLDIPGRAFLAPMAAYTSWPFRRICRRFGAALLTTEVFKARDFLRTNAETMLLLGRREDEHPLAAQILSREPEEAEEAARRLTAMGFDAVELNCGCPKRRVVSDGVGGGLMDDPARIGRVIAGMVRGAGVPVTVKLRAGPRPGVITVIEAAQRVEQAGAAAICVHPRFAQGAAASPPDWTLIAAVKRAVSIPVVGNGGIHHAPDAKRMFDETGCDAVSIGQAAMGRPWIFRHVAILMDTGETPPTPLPEEILDILLEHYAGAVEHYGERRGTVMMRKQSCHYAKRLPDGRRFNEVVTQTSTRAAFMQAVNDILVPAIRAARTPADSV